MGGNAASTYTNDDNDKNDTHEDAYMSISYPFENTHKPRLNKAKVRAAKANVCLLQMPTGLHRRSRKTTKKKTESTGDTAVWGRTSFEIQNPAHIQAHSGANRNVRQTLKKKPKHSWGSQPPSTPYKQRHCVKTNRLEKRARLKLTPGR